MGKVIGRSSRNGGEPATEPVTIKHLVSTIMNTFFNMGEVRIMRGVPKNIGDMAEWDPIPGMAKS